MCRPHMHTDVTVFHSLPTLLAFFFPTNAPSTHLFFVWVRFKSKILETKNMRVHDGWKQHSGWLYSLLMTYCIVMSSGWNTPYCREEGTWKDQVSLKHETQDPETHNPPLLLTDACSCEVIWHLRSLCDFIRSQSLAGILGAMPSLHWTVSCSRSLLFGTFDQSVLDPSDFKNHILCIFQSIFFHLFFHFINLFYHST